MSRFYAKDGQFWLDDQPQFIQAGEFHYFRTPADQWRNRLNLLKEAGFNTLAAYIPWIWHQLEQGVTDFDGHSHPMRNLAGFLDLAAEMGFFIIARPGPYIMAETINEGIPPWVFSNYPQVAFISQDGKSQNIASYLHPDFLSCVTKWFQAIFSVLTPRQVTSGGKIIMVQLDNEMGMIAWVRNIFDTNPDFIARFAKYISATYGKLCFDRYPTENLEQFLADGLRNPQEPFAQRIVADYKCYYRDYLGEYTRFLQNEAGANGMDVLPVINIHGFANGGKTFPIGISQLISVMGSPGIISATDVYPGFIGEGNFHQLLLVNEMTKALQNPNQPLFSIEFQAGGNLDFGNGQSSMYDLHSRLCISSGMRAINHYLFFDGENDPILSPVKRHDWGHPVRVDGSLRKHYYRYPQLSSVLQAYGEALILAKPESVTTIGFLLDYFMTEVNNDATRPATNILTHQRDEVLFDFIGRGLALSHRYFNIVELERHPLDPQLIPLLWVMMDKQCSDYAQHKLAEYISDGGKLVLVGRICQQDFHHQNCTVLQQALGITAVHTDPPFVSRNITAFSYHDIPVSFVERYSGQFDQVHATDEAGAVVSFSKNLGRGKVLVFGASMSANTLDDLDVFNRLATIMDCPTPFNLSSWADIRISHGESGSFVFINNYQDDPLETVIEHQGQALFGSQPVRLAARRGLILPLNWQLRTGITIDYLTAEITGITEDEETIIITIKPPEFSAKLSLQGYAYLGSGIPEPSAAKGKVEFIGNDGKIVLKKTI